MTLREQWESLTDAQLELARRLWDRGKVCQSVTLAVSKITDRSLARTLVALSWMESSLGVQLWNPEDGGQWSGSAGILGVGVKWATIREHGPDFTQKQWDEIKWRLMGDREYCLQQALVQIERGRRKFGDAWWRVWAYYNGSDNWRKPGAQAYARQVYRRWLVIGEDAGQVGSERP